MFLRVGRTIEILRTPTAAPDLMFVGRSRVPDAREIIVQRMHESGEDLPRNNNPALRVIELAILLVLAVYVVSPILGMFFDLQTERSVTLLASVTAGAMCYFYNVVAEALQGRLARLIRLDFLDPYFGRRLRRTIDILKR